MMDTLAIHTLVGKILQAIDAEKVEDDVKLAALRVTAETLNQVLEAKRSAMMIANILRPK
jgi:ribosomal protein L18E